MPYSPTNPVTGGFQLTPATGLNDTVTYPTTPVNEAVARQQVMDMYWQLMNEMNKPTFSAAAFAQYNRLINGGFAVNQRVKSGTVTLTAGQYGHDRWKAGAGGCTYTFATVNNVTTITISAGSLVQVIEGINLTSGTHTLSWTGTAQGKIGAGAYSASGITGTATGGTDLSIEFNTGTLSKVQFNQGDQALAFQPRSFAEELALCQRYYEKSYDYGTSIGAATNVGMVGNDFTLGADASGILGMRIPYRVRKRVTPTATVYDGAGIAGKVTKAQSSGANTNGISCTVQNVGENSYQVFINGSAATGFIMHYTVDAEL